MTEIPQTVEFSSNEAHDSSRQWNGSGYVEGILVFFGRGEEEDEWVEWKTWNLDEVAFVLREYQNICKGKAMQVNGIYDPAFGLYAPGIWRNRGPQGGVQIPWVVQDAWYEHGATARWGYDDIDEVGPAQRSVSEVIRSTAMKLPWVFANGEGLCDSCAAVPIGSLIQFPGERHIIRCNSGTPENSKSCGLCSLVFSFLERRGLEGTDINIFVEPESLATERTSAFGLKLSVDSGPGTTQGGELAFAILPEAGSELHAHLLAEWLRACDEQHSHPISFSAKLPTRVIDVGGFQNGNKLRLHLTKEGERGTYTALSHCWGGNTFCATKETLQALCEEVQFHKLPKTFQDAVTVTRALGVRYLWIDSLCIIQGDEEDWREQSVRMEKVFASAYCTIAATSATSSSEGFLHRRPTNSVKLEVPGLDPPQYAYVAEISENFERDVENSPLSQRAWVLQERALSRRTLHFSATQTYWECGDGTRCETRDQITQLSNILGSSSYPVTPFVSSSGDSMATVEDAFSKYSALSLTHWTDRPLAIVGLESRLARFHRTPSVYGIMTKCLGRSLLWVRSGNSRLEPIAFEDTIVPSWSWMAYKGPIGYLPLLSRGLTWETAFHLAAPGRFESTDEFLFVIAGPLTSFVPGLSIELQQDTTCIIRDGESRYTGWIKFDCEDRADIEEFGCIIMAGTSCNTGEMSASDADKIVLIVRQITAEERGGRKMYCRLGVALIQGRALASPGDNCLINVV